MQQFGSAGRNIAQGPGYTDWDFSLFKNIRVTESKEFQFRAEFFNILNHTNFHKSRQRHELANLQSDSGGSTAATNPVCIEIYVLSGRVANSGALRVPMA